MQQIDVTRAKPAARLLILALLGLLAVPRTVLAQAPRTDLAEMSIEDLMRIEFTSASRKEQRPADVAAAVFLITAEDIRRSGMTTIPDLLRMVPGVQVAQFNSNKWAVSVRGFNGLYSNKLLVLVDGRSVYSRIFSGVFWDAEDLMLDDIDQIEVIRGPGAALWGANAVNGVINIVTKTTANTQGALVRAEGGRFGQQGAVRYGGRFGGASYRAFAQVTRREESLLASGTPAPDGSSVVTTGVRADWTTQPSTFTVEGGFTANRTRPLWFNVNPQTFASQPLEADPSYSQGGHLLGRWTYTRASGASLQVQSFIDLGARQEPVGNYRRRTVDFDTQYHTALGTRHDLVYGAGYRFIDERLNGTYAFSLDPSGNSSSLVTAFLQDEIALASNRLALTLGSQVQYDSDSGAGLQPTARVMWKGLPRQRVWAAASRALRTPSLADVGVRLAYPPAPTPTGLPLIVTVLGNPEARTETFMDAEAGYRLEIGTTASIDVTGYVGEYEHLVTREPGAPRVQLVPSPRVLVDVQFANLLNATTRGVEVAGHWTPIPAWSLDGSYTAFRVSPHLDATSRDLNSANEDGSAPKSQWQVRSALTLGRRATLDTALFHVGRLEQFQVPAYTRADVTAEWRFTNGLSAMLVGQNLFDASHREFSNLVAPLLSTEVGRSVSVRLQWTSR